MPTTDTSAANDFAARRARLGFTPVPEPRVRRSLVRRAPRLLAPTVVVPIDKPMADYAPFNFYARPGWKCIVKLISLKSGIPFDDIVGPRRLRPIIPWRMLAMKLVHDLCGYSLPQIGGYFHRDHSSVLYAIRTIELGYSAKRGRRNAH